MVMRKKRKWSGLSKACQRIGLGTIAAAVFVAGALWVSGAGVPSAQAQSCTQPTPMRFEITGKIVRNQLGFTQGLEFRDGHLLESTGKVGGTTQLNTISLDGQVKTLADHGTTVFGEGLTVLNDEIFQLT